MPGAHRVQDAVEEGERGQGDGAGHGIVGLEALDAGGERALQGLLLVEHPGEETSKRPCCLKWCRRGTLREGRQGVPARPRSRRMD